ncbi:N-terminal nucleophile aminohydrolase [Fragilariopsis cylindrus CCMP1102]|uniref:N-terminal nucleophile aminohydrolase n=1 Tax=Fragilariopsis cylindrus CCMP1102 TaxID=635003 RepID=A0A1E7ESE7_9STRA|nr:N-terminal nucleophile aminohydrolase [Fragilariopsis cylindrus CCMP1102]|eukprot:OEU08940.1 N-terminal nucleophile aminohydrolase [Fragilariopsis cylindrus CCMP1102]
MSILEYNGAAIIAMAGKGCVGIAADRRLGAQLATIACDFTKVFRMSPKLYVGLGGLATDVQTLHQLLEFRLGLYRLKEEREITPKVFSHLLGQLLYEKRFGPYFIEPVVAGLDEKTGEPFLSGMDLIGAPVDTKDFVVTGTCTGNMYGMCEALFKPDMNPEELFETLGQALLSSVDRDALSGWGGVVHIITKDAVITRELKGRMD